MNQNQNFNGGSGAVNSELGGRRFGIAFAGLSCARVAGQLTYLPAHILGQKTNSERLLIPCLHNTRRNSNGQPSRFTLTIWGPLASVGAKFLSPGRAIDGLFDLLTYKAPLFNMDGSFRLDQQGQQIAIDKTVLVALKLEMGEESHKYIQQEIQEGKRPMDWRSNQGWKNYMAQRATEKYDVNSQVFGFARVVIPRGASINMQYYQNNGTGAVDTGAGGGTGQPWTPPANGGGAYNPSPENVNKAFNGGGAGQPWTPPNTSMGAGGSGARAY